MTLVVELRRGGSVSRAGRTSGPRPSVGMLERLVDDNDEFWTAVERLGQHRVPSRARIDPYGDPPSLATRRPSFPEGPPRAVTAGPGPSAGGQWRDHREVIDAIASRYRTGTPWMDLPEPFGSWKGAHNWLRKWAANSTWEKVFTALLAQADAEGDLDWVVAVDSTIVRAHQHAAGARQKGPRPTTPSVGPDVG